MNPAFYRWTFRLTPQLLSLFGWRRWQCASVMTLVQNQCAGVLPGLDSPEPSDTTNHYDVVPTVHQGRLHKKQSSEGQDCENGCDCDSAAMSKEGTIQLLYIAVSQQRRQTQPRCLWLCPTNTRLGK